MIYNNSWIFSIYSITFGEIISELPDDAEERLNNCLNSIEPIQKKVLMSRYKDRLTYEKCGKIIGMNSRLIRGIENRAFQRLRNPRLLTVLNYQDISQHNSPDISSKLQLNDSVKMASISVRAINCLLWSGISTFNDVSQCKKSDLMKIRNFGNNCFLEINKLMQDNFDFTIPED